MAAGTPLLKLLESDNRRARIGLPPDVARGLDADASYTLTDGGTMFAAKIAARRPDLDPATRTVTMLFDIAPAADTRALGDLVMLELETRTEARGAWLPMTALKEGRRGLWTVLVAETATAGWRARPEAVEVLHADAERVFVRGTFRDGDAVLTDGTNRVVAGQRVALAQE